MRQSIVPSTEKKYNGILSFDYGSAAGLLYKKKGADNYIFIFFAL
jgi:hypothetical protein